MLFAGRMVPAGPAHMAMADDETEKMKWASGN